jgi:hypothetical protein
MLASAPAFAEELGPDAEALLSDVSRIVGSQEGSGWFVDADALREIHPTVMESFCRATPAARAQAIAAQKATLASLGDARSLFEQSGREVTDAVDEARRAERELRALEQANSRAAEDCPFWEDPDPEFRGRQSDADRFTLSLETGGLVQLRRTEGTWTFGGGGYGRLLPGYGFGGDFTLLAGPEFGGGAMLRPNTSPTEFVINYFPAIPVVLRFHNGGWHYDAEVGAVGLFQADDSSLSLGTRIGGAIGVKALRTRGVLPWAGLAVAYEHYFESGGRAPAHFVRGGLRVGLMWDP